MLADIFCATDIAVVVLIAVRIGALLQLCTATVIAHMIRVSVAICVLTDCRSTAVVTLVVLVAITVSTHIGFTTVAIALVILILVNMTQCSPLCCTTLRASLRCCTGRIDPAVLGDVLCAADVATVILIAVCVRAFFQNLAAAVVAHMVLIGCTVGVSVDKVSGLKLIIIISNADFFPLFLSTMVVDGGQRGA